MSRLHSLSKLFKSLKRYSKALFTDRHYREFDEKSKKVLKVYKKYLKINLSRPEKLKVEALINRLITLRASINNKAENNDISVKKGASAFRGRISTTLFINHKHKDFNGFFCAIKRDVIHLLRKRLRKFKSIKVGAIFVGKFEICDRREIKYIYNSTKLLTKSSNLENFYQNELVPELRRNLENFEANGSDPRLIEILNLTVNVNKCNPLCAGTYIDLPKFVKDRKAVFNVKNIDNYCFLWCLFKKFYPNHPLNIDINKKRISFKKQENIIKVFNEYFENLDQFTFPFPLKLVGKFEKKQHIN